MGLCCKLGIRSKYHAEGRLHFLKNEGKRKKETTKVREILIQWKDGSTTWESMKYVKEC